MPISRKLDRIVCVGGGPGGLYSAILLKLENPSAKVELFERNRANDTFGFGVVFSDKTMDNLAAADEGSHRAILASFHHWDDIDTHFDGRVIKSTGHGFAGMSRQKLLTILQNRCRELGVEMSFEKEVSSLEECGDADLVIVADGVNSVFRERHADWFSPKVVLRPNKFTWLGTSFPFDAFTFYFEENEDGLFRVHAYRYEADASTFIVECREETWRRAGLDQASEDETIAYCEKLFEKQLAGHRLRKNRSLWRNFPTVKNEHWFHGNVVLVGDAVHTAHFSIGSGTKLAMEDAIELVRSLGEHESLDDALASYENEGKERVGSIQRAAQVSLEWFENTERYMDLDPLQFTFSLLTRSLRVTHDNLEMRDPELVGEVNDWVRRQAAKQSGAEVPKETPPMFTPLRLRGLELDNRVVVSPMCQYSAEDGLIGDWHLVHLGSRATGGAGLVMAEMTDVSRDARITPGCAGMYDPKHVLAWKRVVDFVHEHSDSKIGIQLGHAGRKGSTKLMWIGPDEPLDDGNWPLLAPSPLAYSSKSQIPKEMSRGDMERVRDDFVRSTRMVNDAGFDLLELHFAHGYLLATFLSPLTNHRTDEFGGSIENRMRFPLELFDAVRRAWPEDKPLGVRISATDWAPGGISETDVVEAAKMLREHDCDIIDVSAGQTVPDQKPRYGRLFQTPFSELVRLEAGIKTMTVGNLSSYGDTNSIIAGGRADLCVLARAHLYDPYWTRHVANEQGHEVEWPAQYRSVQRYTPRFK